ncbi:1-deoxy-D-xylulose-5-phosphate synthase [Clostridiaceae bacterium HSG29]|nr:1-deoxy-D-xylulose-5-phosphate synthase [Clostridiaceae bacterium HSG29]
MKNKSYKELNRLGIELRDFLLHNVSNTGGHLSSNLGVVELTIALHYVFNSPVDKIIWDVGHQCYPHKVLTGRKNGFEDLRKLNGMSGFIKRKESEHDIFQAGHSSTSISSAIGMAKARDFDKADYDIIPVIGDGSMSSGMAFEAINYLGQSQEKIIIVLNDNGMSISKNVGAISKSLSNLRTSAVYGNVKKDTKRIIKKIPKFGNKIEIKVSKLKNSLKYFILPNMIFEEMGFTYYGPVDGHDIENLVNVFEKAKNTDGPVIVHAITKKGKGYAPAERNPSKFHGVGKFSLNGNEENKSKKLTYSSVFGEKIVELAKGNDKIFAITAAMSDGTGLNKFRDEIPERFIDVGIAEQNAVTMAAGLAISNKKPFVTIYSTFLQRAYDQILHDVCIQELPVVFCIDRAGIVGEDGETHHGLFDISYLSSIPNMMIMAPKDGFELKRMINFASTYNEGPIAIRYPRGKVAKINESLNLITNYEILRDGKDIVILAVGKMVEASIEIVDKLFKENGISIKLINVRVVKPFNFNKLITDLNENTSIITIEDNMINGGFGSLVNQNIGNDYKILNLGFEDNFVEHGDTSELFKINNLDVDSLSSRIIEFIKK